jgi:hypothetical protein
LRDHGKGLSPMLHITSPLPSDNGARNQLARIRRLAKKRGFRVLKDWTGTFSLVDAKIEPQRALIGLVHVPLSKIEDAVSTPLPPPRPPQKRSTVAEVIKSQLSQADHPAAANFVRLVELLSKGGVS